MARGIKQQYERMMQLNRWLLLGAYVLTAILFTIWYIKPAPQYYGVTKQDGKVYRIPITPIKRPISSRLTIMRWAEIAATEAYTFDANNYRTRLPEVAEKHFTPSGGKEFLNATLASGEIKQVVTQQLIVSAVVAGTPVLLEEGYLLGNYTWKIQMPMLVTYQSASEVFRQSFILTLFVEKVSTRDNPRGFAIDQFLVQKD